VIVRRAIIDDMPAAATVHIITRRVNLSYLPTLHSRDQVVDHFIDTVFPTSRVWVAEEENGGMVVGFAAAREGWLDHLYILPDYQGGGLGSQLLDLAMEGQDEVHLWAFQKNTRARRFYEKRGFSLVRETDGAGNMEKEPDALYRWTRR
jgi:ribosomal protein S18 acetylase RimI-like enzyme